LAVVSLRALGLRKRGPPRRKPRLDAPVAERSGAPPRPPRPARRWGATSDNGAEAEYAQAFAEAWKVGKPEQFRDAIAGLAPSFLGAGAKTVANSTDEQEMDQTVRTLVHLAYCELDGALELDLVRRLDVDMLRLAIAMKLYRDDHGERLPDALGELVPGYLDSIPEDLFAPDQPLRLARERGHWWIYSVGPDRIDQGERRGYSGLDPGAGGDLLSVAEHPRR
jgi:hypothetical protein